MKRFPYRSLRRLGFCALVTALALGTAMPTFAQIIHGQDLDTQIERVERELDRTRDLMERIGLRVKEADIPRAAELFDQAISLQTKARQRHSIATEGSLSDPERQLSQALQLTLQARDLTLRAGQVLHDQVSQQERAHRAIERASTLLDRLRERAGDVDDSRLRVVLDEAQRQLEAAERHYGDRNFEVALRLAESALKLLGSAPGGPEGSRDRLEQELQRTGDALERVQEHAGELGQDQQELLDRATQLLELAQRAFTRNEFGQARRLNRETRVILARLLPSAQVNEQDVRRGLERFDAELGRLQSFVGDDASSEVRELMQRAATTRERAGRLTANGQHDRALQQLRAAQAMLEQASQLAGVGN